MPLPENVLDRVDVGHYGDTSRAIKMAVRAIRTQVERARTVVVVEQPDRPVQSHVLSSTTRALPSLANSGIEATFDSAFATKLALREKQIQQNYRPLIGIHKWFARRPGTVFRALLLSEFTDEPLSEAYWHAHSFRGVIADPFMGGGTPVFEANRLGFHVIGCDVNPMAHWIVRQSFSTLDTEGFRAEADRVIADVQSQIGNLYKTRCTLCHEPANVKYFLWVKTAACLNCSKEIDLFPGYRLAEAERHPKHVLACSSCGELNEYDEPPHRSKPGKCSACGGPVHLEGNVERRVATCPRCAHRVPYPESPGHPPKHRLWAIEYHCVNCYSDVVGRLFKAPDSDDLARFADASMSLDSRRSDLPIPSDEIPMGDETARLHRWGYRRYDEMFNVRQLLGLGVLLRRIREVPDRDFRDALLTVFSDSLRYQNMLCRYDTYALKCQDIFSVHGFPVGLVQCENNLLGIPTVGSGSFHHFVQKYIRAKEYCANPFETREIGRGKELVPIAGETMKAELVDTFPLAEGGKQALLLNVPSQQAPLAGGKLDGVFTDPPYFDNVQYAELIDFCYVWLRRVLQSEHPEFRTPSTRSASELTGNETLGRGIEHFTEGLSDVFRHFGRALKPAAPFVFTYHHNDPEAYLPLIVAVLDADLDCTATLPVAAEMAASLHISGTSSSILDSVFVCRPRPKRRRGIDKQFDLPLAARAECERVLTKDAEEMRKAGLRVSTGDLRCLLAGHLARFTIEALHGSWNRSIPTQARIQTARQYLHALTQTIPTENLLTRLESPANESRWI